MKADARNKVIALTSCERCQAAEARANLLQRERDELLLLVARERARANGAVIAFGVPAAHAASPVDRAPPPPPPLRYRIADRLNDTVKGLLPFAHVAAKRLFRKG